MNDDFNEVRPQVSAKSLDDELINSILPSYHMFQSTISKRLVPNDENYKVDPPRYEMSPLNSGAVTPVASAATMSPLAMFDLSEFPFPNPNPNLNPEDDSEDFTQNSAQLFEKTILANVHKLDNLMDTSNSMASHLDVEITFTDSVCQKGVKPNIIDVSNREYQQEEYLHGYVTMTNRFTEPIPFDIVYVIFEGSLVVVQSSNGPKDHAHPPTVFKFLNMPDLFASWTYANIDRLATDEGNPHDWCVGEKDPYDDTVLSIDAKRLFQPGVTYKRFFSFRIPDRLLDDNCDVHNLDGHCTMLPTLGNPVSITSSRRFHDFTEKKIKDFSFMDTFISYSVSTKIIGKASQYNHKVPKDKFVLTKEVSVPIRVLPFTIQPEYPDYWAKKVLASFKALKDTVEQKIDEGTLVLLSKNSGSVLSLTSMVSQLSPLTSRGLTSEKLRHLYNVPATSSKNNKSEELPLYQNLTSYRKQKLTGFSKVLGVFSLSTPKIKYSFPYIPPLQYRNPLQRYNTQLEIPIDISYSYEYEGENQTPPEPKSVSCELIVMTARSKKHLIPLEFNHDMCFLDYVVDDVATKKAGEDYPNFDSIVIKPFHDYLHRLTSIMKRVGFNDDAFRVETQLFKDIKSLATLQTKHINLAIEDVRIESSSDSSMGYYKNLAAIPWSETQATTNANCKIFTKKVKLHLDLDTCHLKGTTPLAGKSAFDTVCLVPDFQTCLLVRLYYVRITVKHKSGASQVVHVPVTIE